MQKRMEQGGCYEGTHIGERLQSFDQKGAYADIAVPRSGTEQSTDPLIFVGHRNGALSAAVTC